MRPLEELVRPNIRALKPYSTARDEFSGGEITTWLDANENPYDNGVNRYPDPHQKLLKQKIAALKGVREEQVFIGNGSDEAIDLCYRIFCRPGVDNAVSIAPTYGMYRVAADINDVEMREVPLGADFSLPADALLAAADERTRLLWLCSPNNPTGNAFPAAGIERLLREFDGMVVLDEAYIDFAAGEIAPVAAPFADMGLTLSLTDTGGSHAGLTAAYAALPADMCRVARRFGAETLSQVDPADFYAHRQPGLADDRAAHFFEENARVPLMRDALVHRDAETYLRLMNASGRSSEQLLRNIRAPGGDDRLERGLARAAALLDGVGAWRVHGGGFAGGVQALMPRDAFHAYRKGMEALFGPNSCRELHITRAK